MYRILLVDDEILVRDAIKENIDWKSMDCELVGDRYIDAIHGRNGTEQFSA